jgi:hypothetical protein
MPQKGERCLRPGGGEGKGRDLFVSLHGDLSRSRSGGGMWEAAGSCGMQDGVVCSTKCQGAGGLE